MREFLARGPEQLRNVAEVVSKLNPAKPWKITLGAYQHKRTNPQNALYWAILSEVAKETGHTSEEIHEACKRRFLPSSIVEIAGQPVAISASTAKLDVPSFSEYVEQVRAWAATEFGVVA